MNAFSCSDSRAIVASSAERDTFSPVSPGFGTIKARLHRHSLRKNAFSLDGAGDLRQFSLKRFGYFEGGTN